MRLIPLKHTLTFLDISWNPLITDDCIPSLCVMFNLESLRMSGTGVTMDGLRKLSWAVASDDRMVFMTIPWTCEGYMQGPAILQHFSGAKPLQSFTGNTLRTFHHRSSLTPLIVQHCLKQNYKQIWRCILHTILQYLLQVQDKNCKKN